MVFFADCLLLKMTSLAWGSFCGLVSLCRVLRLSMDSVSCLCDHFLRVAVDMLNILLGGIFVFDGGRFLLQWMDVCFISFLVLVCLYAKVLYTWAGNQMCSITGSVNPSRCLPTGALKRDTCSA